MPGTILRKVQPSKAVDLSDPTILQQARARREAQEQVARLMARAAHLRSKASRLPKNSNGRQKATRDALAAEAEAVSMRERAS